MRAQVKSSGGRWAAIIALLLVVVGATVVSLPAWTIPIRIAGWALIIVLVVAMRQPGRPWFAMLREGLAEFGQPVSQRDARRYLLAVCVPVLVVLALAIIWRYV
jgi:hypothetical protein